MEVDGDNTASKVERDADSDSDSSEDEEGGSDSSDDSSSSDEQHETIDDGKLDRLEAKVMNDPWSLESHRDFVAALREAGAFERLRAARDAMQQRFPLPTEEWLRWLDDEENTATSPEEIAHVAQLFDKATKDYLSVEIWARYVKFIERVHGKAVPPSTDELKKIRAAYDAAVTAAGFHATQGTLIWACYREFEASLLAYYVEAKSDSAAEQTDAVRKLWKRQLALPLSDTAETLEQYKAWEESRGAKPEKGVESAAQQSLKGWAERAPLEAKILDAELGMKEAEGSRGDWLEYIQFEQQQRNPAYATCLFERAIKVFPTDLDLWSQYVAFVENKLGNVTSVVVPLYQRALRTCYYSGSLWASYLRALERLKQPAEDVQAAHEQAVAAGLKTENDVYLVFSAYTDFLRRRLPRSWVLPAQEAASVSAESEPSTEAAEAAVAALRAHLQRATEYLENFPNCPLGGQCRRHWANVEARLLRNTEYARELFESLSKGNAKEFDTWNDYVSFERFLGGGNVRSLLKRGLHAVKDDPERMAQLWLSYEREAGTLEEWAIADAKCSMRLKEYAAQKEKEAKQREEDLVKEAEAAAKQKARPERGRAKERGRPQEKRKLEGSSDAGEAAPKRARREAPTETSAAGGAPPQRPPPGGAEPRTVFALNLPWTLDEAKIQELFSKYGPVKDVRMPRESNGHSKGFAYVEYADEAQALAAVTALNLTDVGGRVIQVSISKPPVSRVRAQRDAPDGKTAYVSNLGFGVTDEDLRSCFAGCGGIKEIRIVKDRRTGQSKGFAYVDFVDEQSLENALKLNESRFKGRPMKVARSAPPAKSAPGGGAPASARPSGEAGAAAPSDKDAQLMPPPPPPRVAPARPPRSKDAPKPSLMMPRAMLKATPNKPAGGGDSAAASPDAPAADSSSAPKKEPVGSNADFRKKFLGL